MDNSMQCTADSFFHTDTRESPTSYVWGTQSPNDDIGLAFDNTDRSNHPTARISVTEMDPSYTEYVVGVSGASSDSAVIKVPSEVITRINTAWRKLSHWRRERPGLVTRSRVDPFEFCFQGSRYALLCDLTTGAGPLVRYCIHMEDPYTSAAVNIDVVTVSSPTLADAGMLITETSGAWNEYTTYRLLADMAVQHTGPTESDFWMPITRGPANRIMRTLLAPLGQSCMQDGVAKWDATTDVVLLCNADVLLMYEGMRTVVKARCATMKRRGQDADVKEACVYIGIPGRTGAIATTHIGANGLTQYNVSTHTKGSMIKTTTDAGVAMKDACVTMDSPGYIIICKATVCTKLVDNHAYAYKNWSLPLNDAGVPFDYIVDSTHPHIWYFPARSALVPYAAVRITQSW